MTDPINAMFQVRAFTDHHGIVTIKPVVKYDQHDRVFVCITTAGETHYFSMDSTSHIHVEPLSTGA